MNSPADLQTRVLVVDDDDILRHIIKDTVAEAGAETETALDGLDAAEKLEASRFDIVISDLNMPRMDGMELLRHIRENSPKILVIIVTGFAALETAIEAIKLGAYDYIQKPFKMEELGVVVRNAIEKVRIKKEKDILIEQMTKLHARFRALAEKRYPDCEVYNETGQLISGPLFSDYSAQSYAFLEKPEGNPSRAMAALDLIKGLWRDGAISATEFESLRKLILDRIGPEAL